MDGNSNLQMVNNLRFLAKWSRDISRELSTQSVTLKNVKNGEFFMCAKFLGADHLTLDGGGGWGGGWVISGRQEFFFLAIL